MPDGTSRFSKDGKQIFHFMGCSTFSEYTVIAEISAAKINPSADLNKACLLGCGVSTGWGAAMINPVVKPGTTVAVLILILISSTMPKSLEQMNASNPDKLKIPRTSYFLRNHGVLTLHMIVLEMLL
jgi:Zn-dependent alcohol dehydrogenase